VVHRKAGGSGTAVEFGAGHRVGVAAQHHEFGVVHPRADSGRYAAGLARNSGGKKRKKSKNKYDRGKNKILGSHVYYFPLQEIKVPDFAAALI
jgi:hypothetical protein